MTGSILRGTEPTPATVQGQRIGANTEINHTNASGWVPISRAADANAELQPQSEVTGPANDMSERTNVGQEISSRSQYQGRPNVRTYYYNGGSSNSRRIPQDLSTYRWGWWDLKDRW